MKKTLLLLVFCASFIKPASAQDFPFGTVSDDELSMKKYSGDTSAHAVVLREFGKARIDVGSDNNLRMWYEYHVKIKIFDAKGFDEGTVKLLAVNTDDGNRYETIDDIKGVTYYKDDDGLSRKVELENKKIYPVKENKNRSYYNFALPGLRNGCVIEYSYRKESYRWSDIPPWYFQRQIPKIFSEYEVHIPAYYDFNVSLKGALKLTKNNPTIENKCFTAGGNSCDCSVLDFGMNNIPAFVEEDYMTSRYNFLSAINFELSQYTDLSNGVKNKVTTEWKDIDYQLKDDFAFGSQLKKKSLFKDRIIPVIAGKTEPLDKAKAVYTYIQHLFKWNEYYGIESRDGLSKAIDAHEGSCADINLALVNALTAAGLNAETVLLSTRENGTVNPLYPVISDFDYVIAKVNIGDKNYLLDATDALLPFGTIPLRCLNDKGRVFSLDKPSYWMDLQNLPQREKNTYALDFTLQDDGKLKGTLIHYSIGYDAYTKRKAIKKFNTFDEYVDDLAGKMSKIKILKSEITNLDSLDLPLGEKYEVEIASHNTANSGKIAFSPFFIDKINTNPFKLAERSYPVDWGMPSIDMFVLTMHLPANYTVETPPQTTSIALPNDGGKFVVNYQAEGNIFTFSHLIQFSKSVYSSEEYPYLKELYNKIISSEKAEMIFTKNK